MPTTDRSMIVVALFTDESQAQQAIDALLNAGFNNSQISFAGHGTPGGVLSTIKSFFTGEGMTTSAGAAYKDLLSMGMPQQNAVYYQQEFEAGRSVVAVSGSDRLQEASDILSTYGGLSTPQRGTTGTDTQQQPMTDMDTQQQPMTGTTMQQADMTTQWQMTGTDGE